jgi:hypothetical protein
MAGFFGGFCLIASFSPTKAKRRLLKKMACSPRPPTTGPAALMERALHAQISHTAEIDTLHTVRRPQAVPHQVARVMEKLVQLCYAILADIVGSQCGGSHGFKPCKGHSYRSDR